MLNLRKNNLTLTKEQILDYYYTSCKNRNEFRVGLEYERVSVNSKTLKSAPYEDLRQIITHFAIIKGWGTLKDEGVTVGATSGSTSISLEPGGQFEVSLEPKKNIAEIEKEIGEILQLIDSIGEVYDVKFLPIGITPVSTYQNIEILKKNRYLIMADYLPSLGKFAPVMMRETAGVQVNCDYTDEADALLKLSVCAQMSPFLTGFFANSPIRNNRLCNYKSFRALAWHYTDPDRCGLFYNNLINWKPMYGFEDYVDAILDVPMLFFERCNKRILVNGAITFKEFLKYGYSGYSAEFLDYKLHASLCFPDVRLKNCLEIRNHDSQNIELSMAVCAFYKGILYNENAMQETRKYLKKLSLENINELAHKAARKGLDFSVGKECAYKITKKLFETAREGIGEDERHYLDLPIAMLKDKKCVADKVLENNITGGRELVQYLNNN